MKKNVVNKDGVEIYIKQSWSEEQHPDAMKLRNTEAKRLRKLSYTIICKKWNFVELARTYVYTLEATLDGWEFQSVGGWRNTNET